MTSMLRNAQRRMTHDVNPRSPSIRQEGEDQLTRIENRRGRVTQERHPRVLLGFPEWPPPLVPLRLNAFVERIVIVARVAISELTTQQQRRRVTDQEQCAKAAHNENPRKTMPHERPRLVRVRPAQSIRMMQLAASRIKLVLLPRNCRLHAALIRASTPDRYPIQPIEKN